MFSYETASYMLIFLCRASSEPLFENKMALVSGKVASNRTRLTENTRKEIRENAVISSFLWQFRLLAKAIDCKTEHESFKFDKRDVEMK